MDTLDQREVELGRIKFWYSLSGEALLKLAEACLAKVDRQLFKGFPQERYSTEAAQRYLKDVICSRGNEVEIRMPMHGCIFHWAVNFDDIDNMIVAMRSINPCNRFTQFNIPDLENPFRISFLQNLLINDEAVLQKIFYTCALETSKVELRSAVLHLKSNKYDPPSRQIYERNPLPDVGYVIFEKWLGEQHAKKNKKGGSYKKIHERNATKEMCKKIMDAHIIGKFKEHSLSLNKFQCMISEAMTANNMKELFHKTAAKEFFYEIPELVPYKTLQGAPHKNK